MDLAVNEYVHIQSKKAVSVAQFLASGTSTQDHKDPGMLMIVPEELWRPHYIFTTPKNSITGFKHYIIIVVETTKMSDLKLDGNTIDQTNWRKFYGTGPEKSGRVIELAAGGIHEVKHIHDERFGLAAYGSAPAHCSYAYPAGVCKDKQV